MTTASRHAVTVVLGLCMLGVTTSARAEEGGQIDGVVSDSLTGAPILGATVTAASAGRQETVITDESGRYTIIRLPAGEYSVLVVFGSANVSHDRVVVAAGATIKLSDRLDAAGDVITVREKAPPIEPTTPAKPTYDTATHPLPYSDEAFLKDAWGLAWLLLDVDPSGHVAAVKFYKRPGRGLDEIAVSEAWKMRFAPALDAEGRPMSAKVMYKMEWQPLSLKIRDGRALENDRAVFHPKPCTGSGPLDMSSLTPMYRDCSPPDYKLGAREPWIRSPGTTTTANANEASPKDRATALAAYQADCEGGDAEGCFNLSILFEDGSGVPKDRARARALEEKACTGGAAAACFSLGVRYVDGREPADPTRAASLFDRACHQGDVRGCGLFGLRDQHGGDYLQAVKQYLHESACADRDPLACYNLALHLQKADPTRAALMYQRSCDAGLVIACSNLGLMFQNGDGVLKDPAHASLLYERACAGAEPIGCTNLGQLYMNGTDVRRDPSRARSALEKSCAQGEPVGCFNLAILCDWGLGAPRDEARATLLRAKACKAGYAKACSR